MRPLGATAAALAGTVALLAGAATERAYAYFRAPGRGEGTAQVGTLEPPGVTVGGVPAGALDGTAALSPGGAGDLVITVHNPNAYAVAVTALGLADGGVIGTDAVGCDGSLVALAQPTLTLDPPPPAAAKADTVVRVAGALRMDPTAPSACQGAAFTIPLSVTVAATVRP